MISSLLKPQCGQVSKDSGTMVLITTSFLCGEWIVRNLFFQDQTPGLIRPMKFLARHKAATGNSAFFHSGKPPSSRRALKPLARSWATASKARMQNGPRQ